MPGLIFRFLTRSMRTARKPRPTRTRATARSASSSSVPGRPGPQDPLPPPAPLDGVAAAHEGRRPGGGAADHAAPGPAHHDRGLRAPADDLPQGADRAPQLRAGAGGPSGGGRPSRGADEQQSRLAAGGASEPPSPADSRPRVVSSPAIRRVWEAFPKKFSTRFLPNSSATAAHGGEQAGGVGDAGPGAPKTLPTRSTSATLADLHVLWGGRDRLLRVAEVAEQLAVGAWAVYKLCEDGDLPHVRINNSIRVRPANLSKFSSSR